MKPRQAPEEPRAHKLVRFVSHPVCVRPLLRTYHTTATYAAVSNDGDIAKESRAQRHRFNGA